MPRNTIDQVTNLTLATSFLHREFQPNSCKPITKTNKVKLPGFLSKW